jgi:bis(5'-nucleosyl)-tetraphosphatase (symmetrical)
MATYAIGDIQGCYQELMFLLETIDFNENRDQLWFVGDLVNRGPNSLEVLRFIKTLKNAVVVLGNHDLHLLSIFHKRDPIKISHNLHAVVAAKDAPELVDWLRKLPFLHHDEKLGFVMAHAGIYPFWDLAQAQACAHEIETLMRKDDYQDFLMHMYMNQPLTWRDDLAGEDRFRFIINSFTRMRFCSLSGELDFFANGGLDSAPVDYLPWFKIPNRKTKNEQIIFGHWAALAGKTDEPNVFALDTGCSWGNTLTAMRLEDKQLFSVPCVKW